MTGAQSLLNMARVGRKKHRQLRMVATNPRGVQTRFMHRDKPPGIFDLTDRSLRYAAGFCFVVGFVVSVLVRIGVVLAREHFSQPTPWSGQ
jgi:hypothetical protein